MNNFYLLLVLAGIAALIAILLIIRKRKPLKPKDLEVKHQWWKFESGELRNWADEMLKDLRFLSTRGEWRYRAPWILLLGDKANGKSSVAMSISSGRRQDLLLGERLLAKRGGMQWHFFNGGLLIDPDKLNDERALSKNKASSSCVKTLSRLNDLRPERPLDGIVLTISAKVLKSGDAEAIQNLADKTYSQFWAIQKQFEFSFPVYVLVTNCDDIEGFDSFWKTQPNDRLDDIMGWSSPYSLGSGFTSSWVDEAFNSIQQSLKELQLKATATDAIDQLIEEHESKEDDFFLFPSQFEGKLKNPLRNLLKFVFRPSTYHSNFYFRGIYFTGAIDPIQDGDDSARTDLRFLNKLFEEKIFVERNLAEPTRSGIWSRNKKIRQFQMAFTVVFSVLCIFLATSSFQLFEQKDIFLDSVNMVEQDRLKMLHADCPDYHQMYQLLETISHLNADWTYYSIPVSWVDRRITRRSAQFLAYRAFEDVVFPNLQCHLDIKKEALISQKELTIPDESAGQAIATMNIEMVSYVESVLELEKHYALFEGLHEVTPQEQALESLADLDKLAQYLYGKALPESVYKKNSPLLSSLAAIKSSTPPVPLDDMRPEVVHTFEKMASQMKQKGRDYVDKGDVLLTNLEQQSHKILEDTRKFTWWLKWVKKVWLDDNHHQNPCKATYFSLEPILQQLHDDYSYSHILAKVQESFGLEECYVRNMDTLQGFGIPPAQSIVMNIDGSNEKTMAMSAREELNGLMELIVLDFMQNKEQEKFKCHLPIQSWNLQKLARASAHVREYLIFSSSMGVDNFKQSERPLFDRIAREQLERVLNSTMNQAQIESKKDSLFTANSTATLDDELRHNSREFHQALPSLSFVLRMYQQLGFDNSLRRIAQCTEDYANDNLININSLVNINRLYKPDYIGNHEQSYETFFYKLGSDVKAEAYVTKQFQRSKILGSYAQPFVTFLKNIEGLNAGSFVDQQNVKYWENTLAQIAQQADYQSPTSQPALLADLIVDDLQPMTNLNCNEILNKQKATALEDDLFSDRRAFLMQQSSLYCEDYFKAISFTQYSEYSTRFNRTVAGRFPFANTTDNDATISSVRKIVMEYLSEKNNLKLYLEQASSQEQRQLNTYFEKMDVIADFFAPSVATDGIQPINLDVKFRVLQKSNDGSDQLVSWRLSNGHEEINYPPYKQDESNPLSWRFGQPLILELDWANKSSCSPVLDDMQNGMHVDGQKVVFQAGGNWALLKWLALHSPQYNPTKNTDNVPSEYYFEFKVPVKNNGNKKCSVPESTYIYLGISASALDATTQLPVELTLPSTFPINAPINW